MKQTAVQGQLLEAQNVIAKQHATIGELVRRLYVETEARAHVTRLLTVVMARGGGAIEIPYAQFENLPVTAKVQEMVNAETQTIILVPMVDEEAEEKPAIEVVDPASFATAVAEAAPAALELLK